MDVAGEERLDVAPEYVPAIDLSPLKLAGPTFVPCFPLAHQLAQKIHGMTQPPRANGRNERAKNLVDVLLIRESFGDTSELRSVRVRVCVRVFESRGTHTWPPQLEVHEHWRDEFGRLVAEYALPIGSLEDGVGVARDLIARIDEARRQRLIEASAARPGVAR